MVTKVFEAPMKWMPRRMSVSDLAMHISASQERYEVLDMSVSYTAALVTSPTLKNCYFGAFDWRAILRLAIIVSGDEHSMRMR